MQLQVLLEVALSCSLSKSTRLFLRARDMALSLNGSAIYRYRKIIFANGVKGKSNIQSLKFSPRRWDRTRTFRCTNHHTTALTCSTNILKDLYNENVSILHDYSTGKIISHVYIIIKFCGQIYNFNNKN